MRRNANTTQHGNPVSCPSYLDKIIMLDKVGDPARARENGKLCGVKKLPGKKGISAHLWKQTQPRSTARWTHENWHVRHRGQHEPGREREGRTFRLWAPRTHFRKSPGSPCVWSITRWNGLDTVYVQKQTSPSRREERMSR